MTENIDDVLEINQSASLRLLQGNNDTTNGVMIESNEINVNVESTQPKSSKSGDDDYSKVSHETNSRESPVFKCCPDGFCDMVGQHKARNQQLCQRELELRQRLATLECWMPAVTLLKILTGDVDSSNICDVIEEQAATMSHIPRVTLSQHADSRVRNIEVERKEAQRKLDEARTLLQEKQLAIEERAKQIEVAECTRIELERRLVELEEKLGPNAINLTKVASAESIVSFGPDDVNYLVKLEELVKAEECTKRQLEELERREQAYMNTLRAAGEMWPKIQRHPELDELRGQLQVKLSANQQLSGRICELEDQVEDLKKKLAGCNENLTLLTDKQNDNGVKLFGKQKTENGREREIKITGPIAKSDNVKNRNKGISAVVRTASKETLSRIESTDRAVQEIPTIAEKNHDKATTTYDDNRKFQTFDNSIANPSDYGSTRMADDGKSHATAPSERILSHSQMENSNLSEPMTNMPPNHGALPPESLNDTRAGSVSAADHTKASMETNLEDSTRSEINTIDYRDESQSDSRKADHTGASMETKLGDSTRTIPETVDYITDSQLQWEPELIQREATPNPNKSNDQTGPAQSNLEDITSSRVTDNSGTISLDETGASKATSAADYTAASTEPRFGDSRDRTMPRARDYRDSSDLDATKKDHTQASIEKTYGDSTGPSLPDTMEFIDETSSGIPQKDYTAASVDTVLGDSARSMIDTVDYRDKTQSDSQKKDYTGASLDTRLGDSTRTIPETVDFITDSQQQWEPDDDQRQRTPKPARSKEQKSSVQREDSVRFTTPRSQDSSHDDSRTNRLQTEDPSGFVSLKTSEDPELSDWVPTQNASQIEQPQSLGPPTSNDPQFLSLKSTLSDPSQSDYGAAMGTSAPAAEQSVAGDTITLNRNQLIIWLRHAENIRQTISKCGTCNAKERLARQMCIGLSQHLGIPFVAIDVDDAGAAQRASTPSSVRDSSSRRDGTYIINEATKPSQLEWSMDGSPRPAFEDSQTVDTTGSTADPKSRTISSGAVTIGDTIGAITDERVDESVPQQRQSRQDKSAELPSFTASAMGPPKYTSTPTEKRPQQQPTREQRLGRPPPYRDEWSDDTPFDPPARTIPPKQRIIVRDDVESVGTPRTHRDLASLDDLETHRPVGTSTPKRRQAPLNTTTDQVTSMLESTTYADFPKSSINPGDPKGSSTFVEPDRTRQRTPVQRNQAHSRGTEPFSDLDVTDETVYMPVNRHYQSPMRHGDRTGDKHFAKRLDTFNYEDALRTTPDEMTDTSVSALNVPSRRRDDFSMGPPATNPPDDDDNTGVGVRGYGRVEAGTQSERLARTGDDTSRRIDKTKRKQVAVGQQVDKSPASATPKQPYCICQATRRFHSPIKITRAEYERSRAMEECHNPRDCLIPATPRTGRQRTIEVGTREYVTKGTKPPKDVAIVMRKTVDTQTHVRRNEVTVKQVTDYNCEVCDCDPCGTEPRPEKSVRTDGQRKVRPP